MSSSQLITCTRITVWTVIAVVIQIVGLSLFVFSFFPLNPSLSAFRIMPCGWINGRGRAVTELLNNCPNGPESLYPPETDPVNVRNETNLLPDELQKLYQELYQIPTSFDRLIFMVIDGLPAHLVLGRDDQPPPKNLLEAMPYTQSLLAKGMALGYHAKASPPTVTMPRLKAMLSGAIGGFLDVAFNFNTQALLDDNVIGQFFNVGWKMVMLGDDTWLKLFPRHFTRHDGVHSFYVKDTVEVDYNVSRHLPDELNRTDWDALILHYLGLDHVGHIGGRNSVLMGPKMKEMDEVIRLIHRNSILSEENDTGRTLLIVVSDHGMTINGNHGGSSYEETDSLMLFVGLKQKPFDYDTVASNNVKQVDIAPTIALLFGVPIPKNNVGVLIFEAFDSLTAEQKLRSLELNSWQLYKLLKSQLPGLSCEINMPAITHCNGSDEEIFCCLYVKATALHKVLLSKNVDGINSEEYDNAILAYDDFLRAASNWLSGRATSKPVGVLASGIGAMFLSCFLILRLLIYLDGELYPLERPSIFDFKYIIETWSLDNTFVIAVLFILVLSMGSSSMVEEEHFIWNFLTSTFYLILLRKTSKSLTSVISRNNLKQVFSLVISLISGRIMRGWHSGGVNWDHLPDISKWLELWGKHYVKPIQFFAWLTIMSLSLYSLTIIRARKYLLALVSIGFLVPGMLVLQHILKYQDIDFPALSCDFTLMVQKLYSILGLLTLGTVFVLPWILPVLHPKLSSDGEIRGPNNYVVESRDCIYIVGLTYVLFWCLLQLVLQQPINTMPVSLLFVQIMANVCYFSHTDVQLKHWVQVSALYYLGMAGHFSLGNTNTLATIDVAGAFIGISNHSMFLSGILMFMITYASPMLALLSMVISVSTNDTGGIANSNKASVGQFLKTTAGFPCLVPLGINSVLLASYTIVLLLMRDHLFVWSVFSPKYVYVCVTTACVYVGVSIVSFTTFYGVTVLTWRGISSQPSIRD